MKKKTNKILLAADIFIVFISLMSSWMIRSRFTEFFFTLDRLYFILPYVLLARILNNVLFEEYTYQYKKVYIEDIKKIFWHNLFPSTIFLALRFFSPIHMSRMPLAMIFVEYFLTTAAMVLFRFLIIDSRKEKFVSNTNVVRKAVIISFQLGETEKNSIRKILDNYIFDIDSIITPSSIEWETDIDGIKVTGDINIIEKIFSEYNDIDRLILIGRCTREQGSYILDVAGKYSLECFSLASDGELSFPGADFFTSESLKDGFYIPESVSAYLNAKNIVFSSDKYSALDWKLPPYIKEDKNDIKCLAVISCDGEGKMTVISRDFREDKIDNSIINGAVLFVDDMYLKLGKTDMLLGQIIKAYYCYLVSGKEKMVSVFNNSVSEKIYEKYLFYKGSNKYKLNANNIKLTEKHLNPVWKKTEFTDLYVLEL